MNPARSRFTRGTERTTFRVLAALSLALYTLYFLHMNADYPTLLPAIDWARYTDEGWYGGAAFHHAQTGQWFTPNGFNPAVALPLWPLLLRGWFALTGPLLGQGMIAARVLTVLLFGGTNLLLYKLLRPLAGRVLAIAAVLLTLADPFCYGFNRLAILEPLVAFLFLLALWMARPVPTLRSDNSTGTRIVISTGAGQLCLPAQCRNLHFLRSIATGLLLTAFILTKTTAILLAPAVLYLLARSARPQPTTGATNRGAFSLLAPAIAVTTALTAWLAYFFLLVRPHHLADYNHLFAVNAGKAHGRILVQVMARALGDATWMGILLWALTLLVFAASLRYLRELWRVPLFGSAVLALVLPIAFIGWHTWFAPHYYLPCVAPMMLVLTLGLHALARRAHAPGASRPIRIAHTAAMLTMEAAFAFMLLQTLTATLHPRLTYWSAAQDIAARMRSASPPGTQPKLLASAADDIAFFTGIQAVNPEWPIGGLPALLAQEHPGWYGAFLPWDAKRLANMQQRTHLQEVARYTIQPDSDHRIFILYRVR